MSLRSLFRRFRPDRRRAAPSRRRGSALVIVLGMLSVLLLMAVAFSTFTRTERSGSTNLKNSQVARSAMQTAVAHVIEAIDLSFESPTNNWPVACWPEPFLSSSENPGDDFLQSDRLGDKETANAHVLTAEIAENLTPAQLALIRSSKCDWAPLYASIKSSEINPSASQGSIYGTCGRPSGDSLVGRYAFVAIETTGLLDANVAGTYENDRADTTGEDPYAFNLPESGDLDTALSKGMLLDGDRKPVSRSSVRLSLKNANRFRSTRESNGPFLSMADIRNLCGDQALDLTAPNNTTDYFPADLFSPFTPSLEELDPTGRPKIVLPTPEDPLSSVSELKNFESRALRAMVGIFAESRADTDANLADKTERDQYVFFERLAESSRLKLSRARIATVALLDALDEDALPGQHVTMGNYWTQLPSFTGDEAVPAAGKMIEDSIADIPASYRQGSDSYLNFPATDSGPVLVRAFAYVRLTNAVPNFAANPEDSGIEYRGVVHVGGIAANMDWADNEVGDSYSMSVEFDVLGGEPASGSVAADPSGNDVFKNLHYDTMVEWTIGGKEIEKERTVSCERTWSEPARLSSGKAAANDSRALYVHAMLPVVVRSYVDPNTITRAGSSSGGGEGGGGGGEGGGGRRGPRPDGGSTEGSYWSGSVCPLSKRDGIYIPVRAKFTIKASNGTIVQQIPAPALDKQNRNYWLRMSMGVPDVSDSRGLVSADKDNFYKPNADGKVPIDPVTGKSSAAKTTIDPDHAVPAELGWAACLAPAFGFDTSSLYCVGGTPVPPSSVGVWVNDVWARSAKGGSEPYDEAFTAMAAKAKADGDPEDSDFISLGRKVDLWGLHDILLNDARYGRAFSKFVSPGISAVPDVQHATSRDKGSEGRLFTLGTKAAEDSGGSVDMNNAHWDYWSHIENSGMTSVGDMGSVMCGPFETLSLFQTYRYKPSNDHPVSDFHRVLDYFTVSEDRYPTRSDLASATKTDGTVDWSKVDDAPLFSANHVGRVNLNAPFLIRFSNKGRTRATDEDRVPNPFPLLSALKGASCSSTDSTKTLSGKAAGAIAARFLSAAHTRVESERWDCERDMVFSTAGLGLADTDQHRNYTLETVIGESSPQNDADREAFLRNAANAVTTRGQSFLVVIRADAYSPMYGNEVAVGDGTTLATTHAIVELWRDPEPARYADGLVPAADNGGTPLLFHNWYIRSFRVF